MSFHIIGTGMYVPPKVVTNHDLEQLVDTNDEWIMQRVGVKQRHISENETSAEMGYKAALSALENSNTKPEEIDMILVASVSGDTLCPSNACIIQGMLGVSCNAMDINAACSAFLYLMETAAGVFARKKAKKILVIGTERMSRILDWNDRGTCVIFGDGAGAAVLEIGDGYLDSVFHVTGGMGILDVPQPVGNSPFYTKEQYLTPFVHMKGQETFKFAVTSICRDVKELLQQNDLTIEDIAYVVPHQANKRIIDFAATKLKMPKEKFYVNIDRYGNTSAASVPIVLDEMNRKGMFKSGDLVLFTAFGGGLASAASLIRWK